MTIFRFRLLNSTKKFRFFVLISELCLVLRLDFILIGLPPVLCQKAEFLHLLFCAASESTSRRSGKLCDDLAVITNTKDSVFSSYDVWDTTHVSPMPSFLLKIAKK